MHIPTSHDTHHAEIAKNSIDNIAETLKNYGLTNGYKLSDQFYDDLAWGGLTDWAKRDSSGNVKKDSKANIIYEETTWF